MNKLKVLITGRSESAVNKAEQLLKENDRCDISVRIIVNGHVDPLHDLQNLPDLLLLCDLQCSEELQSLAEISSDDRPALIVFGPGKDTKTIRLAMRAGARDYLTLPLDADELNEAINQVADERTRQRDDTNGSLHVFINGKGGSGASFIATNVAHGLATSSHRVTLVDLDLQFAGLCRYLDIVPERGLVEAVLAVDGMDQVSAQAFTTRHKSGLRLLSSKTEGLHLNEDIAPERMSDLLNRYRSFNDFVIVDLPRHIDQLSATVLEQADRVSLVMQQSFPHLHDTTRLLTIMREQLGIQDSRINVVVNRFDKDSAILEKDIKKSLRLEDIVKIPNHYRLTAESVNSGVPLSEVTNKASVVRGLREFYQSIGGTPERETGGALSAIQGLFRR
jgi:pilus assembly protein CpaE